MRRTVAGAFFGFTCFYWAVLFMVYWARNDWTLPPGWQEQTLWSFKFLGVSIFMGVLLTLLYLWVKRQIVLISLTQELEIAAFAANNGPVPPGPERNAAQGALWQAFCAVLNTPHRIGTNNKTGTIGFKYVLGGSPVLFLHGWAIQDELRQRLPFEVQAKLGTRPGNSTALLWSLLEALDAEGILVTQHGEVTLPTREALWRIALKGRDPALTAPLAEWKMAVVLRASRHFPLLALGPEAEFTPVILGPADASKLNSESSTNAISRRRPDQEPAAGGADAPICPPAAAHKARKVDTRRDQIRQLRQAAIRDIRKRAVKSP